MSPVQALFWWIAGSWGLAGLFLAACMIRDRIADSRERRADVEFARHTEAAIAAVTVYDWSDDDDWSDATDMAEFEQEFHQ